MRFVVWFILCLAVAAPAASQSSGNPIAQPEAVLAQAKTALRAAAAGMGAPSLTDDEIQARLSPIPAIQAQLVSVLADFLPRQRDLTARLSQLGAAPAKGLPPEDPRTAQARHDLARRLALVTGDVQQARLLTLTADQISTGLSDRLRANFAARLWTRNRSILDPGLWRDFAASLPDDVARVTRAIDDELDRLVPAAGTARGLAIGALGLFGALLLVGPGRVLLNRLGYRRVARGVGEARLRKSLLALWLVVVATATPLLGGWLIRAALAASGAMTPDLDQLTGLLVRVTVFAAFLAGLGRALLSPERPEWRVAPVPETTVARLAPFPGLIAVTVGLASFVTGLNTILGASLASRVAGDCMAVLVELTAVGGALAAVGRARVARQAQTPAGLQPVEAESRLPWILATLAAWAALAVALVAVLVGYLALASFLMRETVWIGAILSLLSLLLRLADDLFPALLAPKAPFGGAMQSALGLSQAAMEQAGVLLSGLARLVLLLIAWVAVFAPFGASAQDIFRRFTATTFVLRLGLVAISPGLIVGGLALFLAGLFITRAIRRWLEVRYLPKTDLDVGLRTSLAAAVTYLGALIAVLASFAYLGLTGAQIALFASALSVGIGFGLQAIIGNFVSGLILLAERPVRVGDWIAIGDLEGDVRKISIRATEIEMMDRSRLIVPNSDLVSKTVRNVTHSGALGRVRIVLKVEGAADPAKVRGILMTRLKDHPKVLKDPPVGVYLSDVRDAALEFTAFAYLVSPRQAYGVKSELLFQIVPDLKAAGIGLAGPTTVVNVGLGERSIEPAPSEDEEAG